MTPNKKIFTNLLDKLHQENRYRVFRCLERSYRGSASVDWHPQIDEQHLSKDESRKVTVWCSNDYLGMSHHPAVVAAAHDAIERWGVGSGGTRNISGTHLAITELEQSLAHATDKEAALVFSSGYTANETALSTLGRVLPNPVFFSDSENHASMIEGMRLGKAQKIIFRHNDLAHLKDLLSQAPQSATKIIAFESVYSMSGDFGLVAEIAELAKRFNAITYLDETHAVALYGEHGGGVAQALGLSNQIDIIQGGLGKGYGVVGGFISASKEIIDVIRSYGSGFIFTTSMPPMVAAAAKASVEHLMQSTKERDSQREIVALTKELLSECGLPIKITDTHIVPFKVGCSGTCTKISEFLLQQHGVYLQPINYPTVARGEEILRITPTPLHTIDDLRALAEALSEAAKGFGLISEALGNAQESGNRLQPELLQEAV